MSVFHVKRNDTAEEKRNRPTHGRLGYLDPSRSLGWIADENQSGQIKLENRNENVEIERQTNKPQKLKMVIARNAIPRQTATYLPTSLRRANASALNQLATTDVRPLKIQGAVL